jgi:DNA-binding GntR family transcriptional regulator
VRQAIAEMITEGTLYRQQGKGTFVARRKVNQGLSRIVTFSRTVMGIGLKPSTRILFVFTTRDHSPLELRRALYRGDYYKFNVVRDLA